MIIRRYLPVLLLALSLFLVAGCSGDASGPVTASQTATDDYDDLDFNDSYGGLTTSDEEVAFGDDALKAMLLLEDGEAVEDPLEHDPEVLRLCERAREAVRHRDGTGPRFTYLRLRWGMLHGPDDSVTVEPPCDIVNWTGELHTDRGIVLVKRLIRFEKPVDHVIWPRLNRQTVAFQSYTGCHYDGLLIQIIEPPVTDNAEPEAPNQLHINMPLFSVSIDVADLAGMDRTADVDDAGHQVQLTGFALRDIEACPKGFLSGSWRRCPPQMETDRPDTVDRGERMGSFAGAWYTLDGRINGFLRGGYGVDADGVRVFRGKAIDRHGRFHALLTGNWEPGEGDDLASFRGDWVLASGRVEGILGGTAQPVENSRGGFFTGRWTSLCDDEAEDAVD